MAFDVKSVKKQTGAVLVLSQVLRPLGFVAVVLGIVGIMIGLYLGFYGLNNNLEMFNFEHVLTGTSLLFWGLILLAAASLLKASRSVAVNCARIAEK
ncbi:MAG: hypothetical protein VX527_11170 [Planctomycetota bacterium]|nr:hypothetical protein [Planctomycetota bacterium]